MRYKVINYRAVVNNDIENITSNYESDIIHGYIIDAKSEDLARSEFTNLWDSEVNGFHPMPELNIISVIKYKESDLSDSEENKIYTY